MIRLIHFCSFLHWDNIIKRNCVNNWFLLMEKNILEPFPGIVEILEIFILKIA